MAKCAHCGHGEHTDTPTARLCLSCGKVTNNDGTRNEDRVLVNYAGNLADIQRGGEGATD